MKHDIRERAGRFRGYAAAFVAVILLTFPGSTSVLCIAPGNHIAIEDVNATCCKTSDIIAPAERQPDDGFNAAGNCQNCTDLFLAPNWWRKVSESSHLAAASPLADKCLENQLSAHISLSPYQSGTINNIGAPIPVFSSVPLRC